MSSIATALFLTALTAAALSDVARRTIPNALTLGFAAAAPVALLAAGVPAADLAAHAAVGAATLAAGFALFALGWFGGGDAKLAAAATLWLGPAAAPDFLFGTAMAGGLLSLGVLALRLLPSRPAPVGEAAAPERPGLPYGVALAAGGLFALPAAPWLSSGL